VFSQQSFLDEARANYVLVTVDFPRDRGLQSEEVRAQNDALKKTFPVSGFPSVYLTDAEGRPYAVMVGFAGGGPQEYLGQIESKRRIKALRDASFGAAAALTGVERARKLDEALAVLPSDMIFPSYQKTVEEIALLDLEDVAGLHSKWWPKLEAHVTARGRREIRATFLARGEQQEWQALVADMEGYLRTYGAFDELAQLAHFGKAVGLLEQGDLAAGLKSLETAQKKKLDSALAGELAAMIAEVLGELNGGGEGPGR
jgi:hypothetical protein